MVDEMTKIGELDLIIKPSKIEGVGVFANKDLKKGSKLYWDKRIRKIPIKKAKSNKKLYEMCERYCIETKSNYHCPLNFYKMSIIWFLNHSKNPNMIQVKGGWVAKRNINKGEELTINYDSLNSKIPNANYLNKKLK